MRCCLIHCTTVPLYRIGESLPFGVEVYRTLSIVLEYRSRTAYFPIDPPGSALYISILSTVYIYGMFYLLYLVSIVPFVFSICPGESRSSTATARPTWRRSSTSTTRTPQSSSANTPETGLVRSKHPPPSFAIFLMIDCRCLIINRYLLIIDCYLLIIGDGLLMLDQ